jgi:hypothetical protein
MVKTLGWLGGIVAAVVAGLLVWYFTVPTTFEGMVYDQRSNAPVSGATVIFEIQGVANNGPFRDVTDNNGSYKLDVSNLHPWATVVAHVQANGYRNSDPFAFPSAGDNRKDFSLTANPGHAVKNFLWGLVRPQGPTNSPPNYTPKIQANHVRIG